MVDLNLQKKDCRQRSRGKTEMCRLESVNVPGSADKDNKGSCETLGKESNNAQRQTADISVQTDYSLSIGDMHGVYEKLLEKTEKIERLEEELTEGWKMWNDIQLRNLKLQQEVDSLTSSIATIRAQCHDSKLQQTAAQLQSTISELTAQSSSLKSEKSAVQDEAETLRRELDECKKEKEACAVILIEAKSESQRLSGELSLTLAALDDARRENESRKFLREEMGALLSDHDCIARKVADLQHRLCVREAKVTALRKESKEKSITIATLQSAVSCLQLKLLAAGALL